MKRVIFAFGILVCCNLNAQSPKTFATKTNALDNFTGYKVAPNARQLGTEYWENTNLLSDIMICVFQKNYEVFFPPQGDAYCAWTQSICNGDFNNDGYIDVFNSGSAFGGKKANLSFLIWNPATQKFEEKNLINDKTNFIGAPTKVSPVYLNDDNYVDLVIFGHRDERYDTNPNEQVTIAISDGKGGYDLTKLELEPKALLDQFAHEHGSVADLNGDKLPDLFIAANNHSYIFWGIANFPYFSNKDFVDMNTDFSFYTKLKDINKDGYNDIFIANNIQNKILINNGNGVFSGNEINVPYPTSSTNTMNVYDYIVDDLNGDGLNDFININATNHLNWTIEAYIQQTNGSFNREVSWIEYTLSLNRNNYRNKLIYYDFDGDGKKDITYSDTGMAPYTSPDNEIKKKTVFIRSGNKFIEKDFFQYDPYAKYLFDSLKGKPNCPPSYSPKPPNFNTSNYSFCYGDSLKLTITNINKGDSIKWYYGLRRDLSNISTKYFYDSTKLFVIRIDSNGCSASSDTIRLSVKEQPQFRLIGNQSLAYNKDTTTLLVQHETKMISGQWYFNDIFLSDKDSVILKNLGEYKYIQTDANGCMNTEKFILKKEEQVGFRLKKYYFDIKENKTGGAGVNNGPSTIMYNADGQEHIIHTLATSTAAGAPPMHFIKKNGDWLFEGIYNEVSISGGARNYSLINNSGELAIASHGTEAIQPWPLGDIFTVKTIGDKLKWKKLNSAKSFYHSVATGDMNSDGTSDVFGIHMGTYGNWGDEIHSYLLNKDSSYLEARGMIDFTNYTDNYQKNYGSTLLVADIDNDNKNELIKGAYGYDGIGNKFSFLFFKYDSITNKIRYYSQPDQLGIFRDGLKGSTSIKTADIDNDGDKDMVVVIEGPPGGGVQIWLNDGKGNFRPDQIIYTYESEYGFREFELADINNDGQIDLLLHPNANGNKFRINPRPHDPQTNPWGYLGDGIMLQSSIYLNNKGKFIQLNAELKLPGLHPDFMKGYHMNNKLKFIGFEEKTTNNNSTFSDYNLSDFYLYEVELTFCKNLIKPIFNTSNFSFCTNDSLKLNITNRKSGDTISWYYGSTVDTATSKIFKEATNLYIIRTDSLGCKISSDTITITKNALPALPSVKDTVFCQNISSSTLLATGTSGNTITWYGTNATGGTGNASAVVAPTTDTTTKSYYVSQINNTTSCESPRAKITVKINPAPASPSVKDTAYCNNISADTLKATFLTGHSLNWYGTSATGGTASILGSKPITTTVGSFNYYVSQKNNTTGCEGARAKIGVTINPLPIAPVVRDTNYCNNASADTIRLNTSTGATLLWYGNNATGGTGSSTAIKPSTATVGAANYYLSQIITATGCEGPRSKVVVTTKPIPSAPALSRDTANFLLSGAPGTTWYKDGSAITDTAQKYKPTSAGSYTAKTTTNSCTSVMSAAYYYLVTDIINLSKDEFIKLAPNPFINQLNFDFIVKGYQKLNIEVYDVATGSKVATQQNITAGTQIQLGQLARGTYIVRVTSNDNKIAQQFKMVKL